MHTKPASICSYTVCVHLCMWVCMTMFVQAAHACVSGTYAGPRTSKTPKTWARTYLYVSLLSLSLCGYACYVNHVGVYALSALSAYAHVCW